LSSRRQNPRQKVRCQFCNTISYTRTLDQDLVCMTCDEYAKRFWQTFKKVIENSGKTVYVLDSVNCENCKSKEVEIIA